MPENEALWYLAGEEEQPAGPYTPDQISEWLRTGQVPQTTLCWCQGMSDWRPLTDTQPFAAELRQARGVAVRRMRRIAIIAGVVVCAIVVAAVVYTILMGPAEVRRAKELAAAGLYKEAADVLGPYIDRHPLDDEAAYLLAVIKANQYAGAHDTLFGANPALLEEAKQLLTRVLKMDPEWREQAGVDVADAGAQIPPSVHDRVNRALAIAGLRADLNLADKKQLVAELLSVLMPASKASSAGDLSRAVTALLYWAKERPAFAETVSTELLKQAEFFRASDGTEQAKMCLRTALQLNPEALNAPEDAVLFIRLMDADDAKLTQCQLFLSKYPDSPDRAEVLMVTVKDAVSFYDRYGRWRPAPARPYMVAAVEAAGELLEHWPKTANLDTQVLELGKRLAQNGQPNDALKLTGDLLKALPDSPIKVQIENAHAQWRVQAGKGTLPPELDTLAGRVEKELDPKIKHLSTPSVIRGLIDGPMAARVIQIADGCTADKFNSQQKDMLLNWVAEGGIVWANNNVLSLFGVNYQEGWGGSVECNAVGASPILAGCRRVVVSKGRPAAYNLNYRNVIPLLTAGEGARKYCNWSLVPYGRGWISDVKTVDITKYDGARFRLQFRRFCLDPNIPGTRGESERPTMPYRAEPLPPGSVEPSVPTPALPEIIRISSTQELEKSLAAGDTPKLMWVALSARDAGPENVQKLREWVREGGVLWVETDLIASFGLSGLRRTRPPPAGGRAEIARGVTHPVVSDLTGQLVDYELGPNGFVITESWRIIERTITPFLVQVQPDRRGDTVQVVSAALPYGKGVVIFRPANIDTTSPAGESFESKLLSFSLNPAKNRARTPAPERERPRPPVRPLRGRR